MIPTWEYDVFLSYSGDDTSRNFIDHLVKALNKKGILVASCGGGGIPVSSKSDVGAIGGSRFGIVVFSNNYASSLSCLDELLNMVESHTTILPVFYDVDPSTVRKQSHSFKEAFDHHMLVFHRDLDKVQTWRKALSEVAGISGFHLVDKSETQCIQQIVEVVLTRLNDSFSNVVDDLVGLDHRIHQLITSYLMLQSGEVRTIAICGVPGIGKTTIARSLCHKVSGEFQGTCFLSDVSQASRKYGLQKLQGQIISEICKEDTSNLYDAHGSIMVLKDKLRRKRVLLILDGIDDLEQLEMLAGSQDWFGPGSRIIITATDEDLFRNYEVDDIYWPATLEEDEALQLLSLKAFNQPHPPEHYVELSKQIVSLTNGIPAAICAMGTFLFGRSSIEWESTVRRPHENVKW
uniref:TIR domain-containing protein n=1 Tax=Kalanchoe fedtschenkoi TaxID=63787 RepID=A0A7N0TAZ7_KALFE